LTWPGMASHPLPAVTHNLFGHKSPTTHEFRSLTMTELPPALAIKAYFRPDHDQGRLRRGRSVHLISFISHGSENPGGFRIYSCL
jgi:hypothetical protein